jgi:hypothetical protein
MFDGSRGPVGFEKVFLLWKPENKRPSSRRVPTLVELSISPTQQPPYAPQPRIPRIDFLPELVARDLIISVCFYRLSAGFNRAKDEVIS